MNIRTIALAELTSDEKQAILRRSAVPDPDMRTAAFTIVDEVRRGGDVALLAANERYGGGAHDGALLVDRSVGSFHSRSNHLGRFPRCERGWCYPVPDSEV